MGIRRLTTDDIDIYRDIRLRALRADPQAFGSSFEHESAFDDTAWRQRLSGFGGRPGVVFVRELDDVVRGVVGIAQSNVRTDALLWGMWVDPTARGHGVAAALVAAAYDWASEQNLSSVVLFVHRTNDVAIKFYERIGFHDAADWRGEHPADCTDERCMSMSIYAATP